MPVNIPVHATQLEESILRQVRSAGRKIGSKGGINLGTSAKSIEALSQPLGRITGKADQFTKSMEAANARVLAFGASVGVLSAVTKSFKDLVTTTIEVEKQLTAINAILGTSSGELERFKKTIFDVARGTEQSFDTVATAALEFSRQGLKAEEVVARLNDSMILARLSGLGAAEAVAGLTAAINSFNSTGITSSEVLNKLSAAAKSAAVSERDLIEAVKRSGAVAIQAGVEFDELVGVVSAVQEKTARGGAVIGNSFKTIFTRLQSLEKLKTMRDLGVQVTDTSGAVLSATQLIENLGKTLKTLPSAERLQIAEGLVGKFQVAPFLAILEDMSQETSRFAQITKIAGTATDEAYTRNIALNKTLSAAINEAGVNLKELANTLGEIGVTDSLRNILGFFNNLVDGIKNVLEGEGLGSDFARGIVKGIGNVISGPGLAIFGAIIAKLTLDLVKFGVGSLKTFFGLNSAAKQIAQTQGQIAATLLNNKSVQDQILAIEKSQLTTEQKKVAQTEFFTQALNKQLATMQKMQAIAARVAPGVVRGTGGRSAAGGFIPNFAGGYGSEQAAISRGVGGAPPSAKPVTIPNFAFGGGVRGSITANTSEYIVPNFAGGGSAIFNQNMVKSMGLPAGARKVGAAGGYIPNFANPMPLNQQGGLILLVGNRGQDNPERQLFAGKVGSETRGFINRPTKGVTGVRPVKVPTYKLGPKGTNSKTGVDIADIKKGLAVAGASQAKLFAKQISGKAKLPTLTNKQIEGLFNPGAFEGFAGSVFEVSLAAILGSKQFLDYSSRQSTSRVDLPYSFRLFSKFGAQNRGQMGAEVKATDTSELVKSAAAKFYDIFGGGVKGKSGPTAVYKKDTFLGKFIDKTSAQRLYGVGPNTYQAIKNNLPKGGVVSRGAIRDHQARQQGGAFAGGYIPNFAGGALMDAISREQAAGLPINQIRINQNSRLRSGGNPMGLAVTNVRDEPTGAVPNYAKPKDMSMASGDLMMKFMGLTMAASMLSGVFSQMGDEASNFSTGMNQAIQALMMMAMLKMTIPGAGMKAGGVMGAMGMAAPGPLYQRGEKMSRVQKGTSQKLTKVGGLRGLGGGLLKGLSIFGRFLPVLGQVIFGFQALSGVLKMVFGFDLGKKLGQWTKGLGMALNIVDTPAEKAAKALNKVGEAAAEALSKGAFGKTTGDFQKFLFESLPEDRKEKLKEGLTEKQQDAIDDAKDDKKAEKMRVALLQQAAKQGSFAINLSRYAEAARVSPEAMQAAVDRRGVDFEGATFGQDAGLSGMQVRRRVGSGRRSYYTGGGVSLVQQRALEALDMQLSLLAGPEAQEKFNRKAKASPQDTAGEFQGLVKSAMAGMNQEQRDLVAQMKKDILTKGDPGSNQEQIDSLLEALGIINEKRKEEEEIVKATEKIQESLAQSRIKNMVEMFEIQNKLTSGMEFAHKTEMSLLSTSVARKKELEGLLAARKLERDRVGETLKVTSKLIQSEGAFVAALKSRSPNETIELKNYEDIRDVIKNTNDLIVQNKGFTKQVADSLYQQVLARTDNKDIAQKVVDLVAEETKQAEKRLNLQSLELAREKFRATLASSKLKIEERIVSNLKTQLSVQSELSKLAMEQQRISMTIAELEAQKVGAGKMQSLAIEKAITEERKKQINLEARSEQTRVLGDLRSDLFAEGKAAGMNLGELGTLKELLNLADTEAAFKRIAKDIDRAQKEQQVAAIKAARDEKLLALDRASTQNNAANYFFDVTTSAADIIAATLIAADKDAAAIFEGLPLVKQARGERDTVMRARTARDSKLEFEKLQTVTGAITQISDVYNSPQNLALIERINKAMAEGNLIEARRLQKLLEANTALKQSGDIFQTFAKLVDDFFFGITDRLAQLEFGGYRETSASGVMKNIRDKQFERDLAVIDASPLNRRGKMEKVGRLDEARTIQEMRDQAYLAATGAEAMGIEREIEVLQKIFKVKKDLEEGTIDEAEATKKLLKLEKERLQVNDSLKATFQNEFIKKDAEIAKQFNEKFVGAARAFSTEITHGIVDAIAKGEKLKDVLLGAATNFLNTMAKAFMDRAVDDLVKGLSSFTGSIGKSAAATGAEGGIVRGGSGSRDDVPALLMGGEYVMRKGAVKKYGLGFFETLNNGNMQGFANGGFIMPGLRGAGAISGKRDLLRYAGQSSTAGKTDRIFSGANFASINLEPESMRLTNYGRATDVMGQKNKQAKEEALGLYFQQLDQEKSRKEQRASLAQARRDQKKAFWTSLGMAALSAGVAFGAKKFKTSMKGRKVGGGGFADSKFMQGFRRGQSSTFGNLGMKKSATGGYVGDAAGVDTIPSMLSGGEFVMNAGATQRIGANNLQSLNAGGSMGGADERVIQRLDNIAENGRGETTINITVNSNGSEEGAPQGGGDTGGRDQDNDLAIKLKDAVREVISQEQRLGGMLRK